jgi:hypothetical protein
LLISLRCVTIYIGRGSSGYEKLLSGFFHVVVGGWVEIVGNTAVEKLGRGVVAFGGEEQPPYECFNTRPSVY